MDEVYNLTGRMESQLPHELLSFLRVAGEVTQSGGQRLYLVGGVVRDLLLGRSNLDIDLVAEGDAINLARELTPLVQGELIIHKRFGTATLKWAGWSADIVTARSETYSRPGALPSVKPGSINSDLFRRDFTINAMAVDLTPGHYGTLLDLYSGRDDLRRGLIRVLHDKSFVDDATRIWRAIRYEQRLGFRIEPVTLNLLKRDAAMLATISGDRIRHELELVLKEDFPEKVLRRAGELGVLAAIHPSLKGDGWLAEKFGQARRQCAPDAPPVWLYLAVLSYRLSGEESGQLISSLRLPRAAAQTLRDAINLKAGIEPLSVSGLSPSRIHSLLHGYSPAAITANLIAADSKVAKEHVNLYLSKLRYVRPSLTGNDLKRMGVPEGPRIKEILAMLRDAKMDGKVKSRQDEERLVEGWGRETI